MKPLLAKQQLFVDLLLIPSLGTAMQGGCTSGGKAGGSNVNRTGLPQRTTERKVSNQDLRARAYNANATMCNDAEWKDCSAAS